MRVIAVANQKGGSGKTTAAVNVGAALAEAGCGVLVVDADPQGSASAWLGQRHLDDRLLDVFLEDAKLAELAESTDVARLQLVPASPNLRDTAIAHAVDVHHALRRALPPLGRYDFVLIDCPPALGHVVISALAAADEALVPVAAHAMELDGLAAIHRTIATVRQRMNPGLRLRVLPCRVDGRTRLAREVVDTLHDRLGQEVMASSVRENVRVAEAPSHERSVLDDAPASAGARTTARSPPSYWEGAVVAERRRLAHDPLADLLPDAAGLHQPAPVEQPRRVPSSGRRRAARITIQVSNDLAEQVRDAVMWLHKVDVHTTISAIAEAGLRAELARLRRAHNEGRAFPRRSGEVPTGRPPRV